MDSLTLIILAGAALAGFVQGLSGFGFGLTAMALWAWTLQPQVAAAMAVVGALTGQLIAVFSAPRKPHWRGLWPFLAGGFAGLPIGLYLLPRLDVPLFKGFLGLLLVVMCPLMFFSAQLPRITRGGRPGDALAGVAGGVMGGLGGFTGVVPTLWTTLRGFPREEQRSVIQNFNLAMQLATFAGYAATGILQSSMIGLYAAMVPVVLVFSLWGARLYARISDQAFRQVLLGLLTLSGIALLVSAVPQLAARAH